MHKIDYENDLLSDLTPEQLFLLQYGDGKSKFYGYVPWITMLTNGAFSTSGRLGALLTDAGFMEKKTCPKCGGTGLGEQASHTTYCGKTITELENMYISDLLAFFQGQTDDTNLLVNEIMAKLLSLVEVGIGHLSLSRPIPTLSGGEIQRLFLASYMITEMDSIIFVFDEPTIGLHEVEKENLIRIIKRLVENGNTVIAVEHDSNFIRQADYIIDMGPGAGVLGGMKIYEGGYDGFLECTDSKISPYLSDASGFPVKAACRPIDENKMLTISNANLHNLKHVSAKIPLGIMVGIAGVSGSGKSSLISDTLVPKLKEMMKAKCITTEDAEETDTVSASVSGVEQLTKCYVIDQRPIGRSRTSCPATYTGIFDRIRTLFANTETARKREYPIGMFTVNSVGGCKKCRGDGVIHYHVGFGNHIDIPCDSCEGTGYLPEVMEVLLNGKNIRDILEMNVDEAIGFFQGIDDTICNMLEILQRVGLGYIQLGQATPTISGGESQRIKLAKELSKNNKRTKDALYILDEPTTGLSFYDAERLMKLLNELVDSGNSIIVTEHDPYVLSNCDYILEMGPGGGTEGGILIAEGTPQELKNNPVSIIGNYLMLPSSKEKEKNNNES